MSTNAWAIPHAHADTYRQSQSHPRAANAVVAIRITITRVDFYDGATLIGYTVAQPYNWTYTWANAPQGSHVLTAKAYDSAGRVTISAPVNITVTAGGTGAPTIAITAPATGAAGTAVAIAPTVTAAGGATVTRLDYFAGTTLIGSFNNTSTYQWLPLAAGTYSLTARVTDSDGRTATSAPVNIVLTDINGETITFLHNDFAGSAIAATDASGATLWKESYTPFGDRAVKAVAGVSNRQFFTGKPVDSETGLSNFGARMYDPVVGRFMGVDAVGFQEGNLHSFNRYAYANNNPYRFVDPSGNSALSVLDWYDFGKDVGGLLIDIGIYAAATVAGNKDVQHLASQGLEAGVGAAALSTVGIINPVPGTSRAVKTEIKAVEIGSKIEKEVVPLKRLHSDETYKVPGEAKSALESQQKRSTDEIINSLKPGSAEPLKVKPNGTVMDGNTRVKVLEERGVNVNELPRTTY